MKRKGRLYVKPRIIAISAIHYEDKVVNDMFSSISSNL